MKRRDIIKLLAGVAIPAPALAIAKKLPEPDEEIYELDPTPVRGYLKDGVFKRIYPHLNVVQDGELTCQVNHLYFTAPLELQFYAKKSDPKDFFIRVIPNPDLR